MKITFKEVKVDKTVTREDVEKTVQVLVDNGIEPDEAETVMQAVGYTLLGAELYEVQAAED